MGGAFRHRISSGGGGRQRQNATVAMDWRWECVFVLSTKFRFTHRHSRSGSNKVSVPNQYLEIKTEWSAPVAFVSIGPGKIATGQSRSFPALRPSEHRLTIMASQKSRLGSRLCWTRAGR